ncbi:hypothetical protein DPMN_140904 [Dreissena polymorpha]|uniref:Uncharacterized protein n=1 Tax=Dreissena polymorpha TaxID=45954 RepID=A0A9D4GBQ3_DREPO|nr:hypothetical protein DPMN_140904 [Dreissena polymorpha]
MKHKTNSNARRRTTNATLLTRFCYSHTRQTASLPSGHVFQLTVTIFELSRCIITTNVRTKFYYSHTYVVTIFEHDKDITETTFLTKFYDNQAINVTYRVLPRKNVDDAIRTNGDAKSTP